MYKGSYIFKQCSCFYEPLCLSIRLQLAFTKQMFVIVLQYIFSFYLKSGSVLSYGSNQFSENGFNLGLTWAIFSVGFSLENYSECVQHLN